MAVNDIKPNTVWKHRSGRLYVVVAVANTANKNSLYPEQVVYMGENGNWWTKPTEDFLEKMEMVT